MQSAELIGLDEIELRGFLTALQTIWNDRAGTFETGIELVLSNYVDTEKILASTHLYTVSTGFLLLFTEFLREVGAATFKIYAYVPGFGSLSTNQWAEKRLSEIIMEFSERDLSSFLETVFPKKFTCPLCGAQYSFRVIKKIEEGLFECQNCGKRVHVQEPETDDTNRASDEHGTPSG